MGPESSRGDYGPARCRGGRGGRPSPWSSPPTPTCSPPPTTISPAPTPSTRPQSTSSATRSTQQLEAAVIPFTGSSLRLRLMFLHLLRRVTMNLLPLHYKVPRRFCTRGTPRALPENHTNTI